MTKQVLYGVLAIAALLVGGVFLLRNLGSVQQVVEQSTSGGGSLALAQRALQEIFSRQRKTDDSLRAVAAQALLNYAKVLDTLHTIRMHEAEHQRAMDTALVKGDTAEALRQCSIVVLDCQRRAAIAESQADTLSQQVKNLLKVSRRRCGLITGAGVLTNIKQTTPGVALVVGCIIF